MIKSHWDFSKRPPSRHRCDGIGVTTGGFAGARRWFAGKFRHEFFRRPPFEDHRDDWRVDAHFQLQPRELAGSAQPVPVRLDF